jgi:hypothetical protein
MRGWRGGFPTPAAACSAGAGTVRKGGDDRGRRSGDGEVTVGWEGPNRLDFFLIFVLLVLFLMAFVADRTATRWSGDECLSRH